jgi:hypothetical protein
MGQAMGRMLSLRVMALFVSLCNPSAAQDLWNHPATVVDKGGYLEISGIVPAYVATGKRGCGMEDLSDPDGSKYIPAVCAEISATLPAATVLVSTEIFAKINGSGEWQTCKRVDIESAKYRQCKSLDPNIQLPDGRTAVRWCMPTQRNACGNDYEIDFKLGRANYSCANIGPEFLKLVFGLNHVSRTHGYDFLIKAHYKRCGGPGPFKSN